MVVHVELDIRSMEGVVKVDGEVALRTRHIDDITRAFDAVKLRYVYQELGHTLLYEGRMEWRNEPDREYGPQPTEEDEGVDG